LGNVGPYGIQFNSGPVTGGERDRTLLRIGDNTAYFAYASDAIYADTYGFRVDEEDIGQERVRWYQDRNNIFPDDPKFDTSRLI